MNTGQGSRIRSAPRKPLAPTPHEGYDKSRMKLSKAGAVIHTGITHEAWYSYPPNIENGSLDDLVAVVSLYTEIHPAKSAHR